MANTFKFGNGEWAVGKETALAYNDENNNFKPLPFSFDRGSIATVVNKNGLIETVGVDEPRIDFLNNTKGHLLLEPSRQNKLTYSEDFSQWVNISSVTNNANTVVSPDGTTNASNIEFGLTGSNKLFYKTASVTSGQVTASVYLKGTGTLRIYMEQSGGGYFAEKQIILSSEWVRHDFSVNATSTSTVLFVINRQSTSTATEVDIWGAQLEEGSYATSYIPTSGSAVTRSAETGVDCLLPNETIIDNSTATVYLEFEALVNDASNRFISFDEVGTATDNQFEIRLAAGSDLLQIVTRSAGGGQDVVMTETLTDITANNKIAFNYNGLNWKLAVNGTITDTATAARLFNDNIEKIKFSRYTNTNHFYGKVKDLRVYNTALTDAELIALTQV